MNAITTTDEKPISAETMESVLGTGDLSSLTTRQRVEYYGKVCQAIGVNPLTRPFRFMQFQGNTVLYATRDLTDQLRQLRKISLTITDKQLDGELYIVTAQASTPDGRQDQDMGAVTLGQLKGEARANALMKAMTKAKRRVTLSICGLGFLDESEVETLPGAYTFDAEAVETPQRAAAATTPRPPRVTERAPTARTDEQWQAWLRKLRDACAVLRTRQDIVDVAARPTVGDALADAAAPAFVKREISAILAENYARFPDDDEPLPEVEIVGAEKLAG